MKHKGKKVLSLLLAALMIVGLVMPSGALAPSAKAAAGDEPAHEKTVTANGDGTYTIALNVTGDSEKQIQKVNVIVIVDRSGSMGEDSGNTTTTYTATNQNGNNLYGLVDGEYVALHRLNGWQYVNGQWQNFNNEYYYDWVDINNRGTRYTGQRYSRQQADQSRLAATQEAVNGLAETLLGYNGKDGNPNDTVEMALVTFATTAQTNVSKTTSADTYVTAVNNVTVATGNAAGTNWEAALRQADGVSFGDSDPTFVIFFSDGAPTFYLNAQGNTAGTGYEQEPNMGNSYNAATDEAAALAAKVGTDRFYTIFAYGTAAGAEYMTNLTAAAGAPSANNYSASDTAALQEAFAEILEKIEMAGIGNVGISDGTTSNVTTSTGSISLLQVDTSSYKYYRAGGIEDGAEKYDSSANGGLGEEWTDAPAATFENSAVKWNIDGVLENDVTYTVTFKCWPSQATLDIVADIKNNPGEDGAWKDLDPEVQKYIDVNGNLKTNTTASLSYTDTRTGESGSTEFVNPDPVSNTAVEQLTVAKEWENELDSYAAEPVTLDVLRDGVKAYDIKLGDGGVWSGSVYVSIGIMGANGQPLTGSEGHDFTFAEPKGISYHWELNIPTVHPMMINGETVMLIKVDEKHEAPAGADTYTFNGATYYVDEEIASLTAINERRSSLNLIKAVEGEDVPEDAVFPFTLTVTDSLAPETAPSEAEDPGHDSDYWIWISVWDKNQQDVTNAVVSGATHSGGSWYYGESGKPIVLNVMDGYSIRINNLPTGSSYTITEGTLPTGFIFKSAAVEVTEGEGTADTFEVTGTSAAGEIESTNSLYVVTFTNKYELIDINVDKVWDDNSDQDGIRPEELELTLNGLPSGTTAPEPEIVESEDGNTWTYTWKAVPRYDADGNELTYTVTEDNIPEGYTCETTSASDDGIITNSHTPEVADVTVTKAWDDASNQDGKRPTALTLTLNNVPSGVTVPDPTIAKDGDNWTYTWKDLPKYSGGEKIEYTITEGTVPTGYTCETPTVKAGGTITNSHEPDKDTITVTKVWEDASDQDGVRPESVKFTVTGSDGKTYEATLSGTGDTWTAEVEVEKYTNGGTEVTFTVDEEDLTSIGYEKTIDGLTITNSYEPETIELEVTKVWDDSSDQDGMRPDSVKFIVTGSDGNTYEATLSGKGDTWTATIPDVAKYYDGGKEVTFTVEEEEVKNYSFRVDNETLTITNTYPPETDTLTVTKVWDDAGNQDGKRPDSVKFTVTGSDGNTYEATLSGTGDTWTATIEDVAKYFDHGETVAFTVEEEDVDGYEAAIDNEKLTITNSYEPVTTKITVTKIWDDAGNQDGLRPDSVKFTVTGSDGKTYEVELKGEGDTWTAEVEVEKYYEGGKEVTFTVDEEDVDGYEKSIDGLTITNSYEPEEDTITVTKIWDDASNQDGKRPESVKFTVTGSDGKTYEVELTGDGDKWTKKVKVEKYAEGGKEVTFTVDEEDVPGYEKSIDGLTITNSCEPETTKITVTKVWVDADNQDGKRPGSVKFTVTGSDGKTYEVELEGEGDTWTAEVEVEKYYEGGKEVTFTVDEAAVSDYSKQIDDDALTITNSYTPGRQDLSVTKVWDDGNDKDGLRPESIDVKLMVNGEECESVTLDESNSWKYSWNLPAKQNGEDLVYTVEEDVVPAGYVSTVSGSAETGYIITNTHSVTPPPPPPPVTIKIRIVKRWDDNNNAAGKRPDSVTVTLMKDDVAAVVEKLGNWNGWQYEWNAIGGSNYSVIEDPVDGYETSIERSYFNNVITFTVTNKLTETPVLNTKDHVAYIVGYPDGTVRPGREITRAEVATIFFRLLTDEARDLYWSQTNPYPDVQLEDWFNNAISTLTNMGIINGYEDGTFRPDNFITRAELTKIAVCFFTSADQYFGKQPSFTDVPADAWYTRFIAAAEELGLINGYPDGTFRPGNPITRAETCTIVNRTLGRVPEKDHLLPYMQMINWPDNANTNEWYYAQIQEATNSHDYVWTAEDILATVEQWTAKLPERNWVALEQVWSNSHSAPGGEVMDYDPIP